MPWHASLSAALAVSLAQPATTGPEVGSMPLRVPEDLSKPDQKGLQRRFSDGIARSGLQAKRVETSCDDPECYRAAGEGAGVNTLVTGSVEKTGPDFRVQLVAIDATSGEEVARVDGVCEICGVGELGDMVGNLAARLRPTLETAVQPTMLVVDSDPSGAEVWVDGEQVGQTPLETAVAPGPHELDVIKRGHRTEHAQTELQPGVTESFSFRLAKTSRLPPWLPWAALGGGVASLGAGIGLLVIDENPIRGDCNPDAEGNCEFLYDTVVGGAVLTTAGVALIGTGIGLLAAQSRRNRLQRSGVESAHRRSPPRRTTTLRIVPSLRGATLVGHF